VQIWNLNPFVAAVDKINLNSPSNWTKLEEKPLFSYAGHSTEGFALAWNSLQIGTLASGDVHRKVKILNSPENSKCKFKKIFLWRMAEGGKWLIDQRALCDHQGSVEDLGWFILYKIIKFYHLNKFFQF
jgi:ribosome assembly protein RRB1